mmetsp:Transcript_1081/g.2420  ORF Transcript_1081/g.2420 Transcript_1081/m.2420 type:complete len:314 (-) Transcript_1081:157-1098(-)
MLQVLQPAGALGPFLVQHALQALALCGVLVLSLLALCNHLLFTLRFFLEHLLHLSRHLLIFGRLRRCNPPITVRRQGLQLRVVHRHLLLVLPGELSELVLEVRGQQLLLAGSFLAEILNRSLQILVKLLPRLLAALLGLPLGLCAAQLIGLRLLHHQLQLDDLLLGCHPFPGHLLLLCLQFPALAVQYLRIPASATELAFNRRHGGAQALVQLSRCLALCRSVRHLLGKLPSQVVSELFVLRLHGRQLLLALLGLRLVGLLGLLQLLPRVRQVVLHAIQLFIPLTHQLQVVLEIVLDAGKLAAESFNLLIFFS